MNLNWMNFTPAQKGAISMLCKSGDACVLPTELAEQLINLGLIERVGRQAYSITPLGSTVRPSAVQ